MSYLNRRPRPAFSSKPAKIGTTTRPCIAAGRFIRIIWESRLALPSIPDLADHDDVRILPENGPQGAAEREISLGLDTHRIEFLPCHFYGILDGCDVHVRCGQDLEGGIQGRRFSASGRPRHQDNPMGLPDKSGEERELFGEETQLPQILHEDLGIEDAYHYLFPKGHGKGGDPHLDVLALPGRFDPPVL